jgi:hypothetical protein
MKPMQVELGSVSDSAVDDADAYLARERPEFGVDLIGELAGRSQNECTWELRGGAADGRDKRYAERECLT